MMKYCGVNLERIEIYVLQVQQLSNLKKIRMLKQVDHTANLLKTEKISARSHKRSTRYV